MGANPGRRANFVRSANQNDGVCLTRKTSGPERVHRLERIIRYQKDHEIVAFGVTTVREYIDATGGDNCQRLAKCGGFVTNTNCDLDLFACFGHEFTLRPVA